MIKTCDYKSHVFSCVNELCKFTLTLSLIYLFLFADSVNVFTFEIRTVLKIKVDIRPKIAKKINAAKPVSLRILYLLIDW
jgi:hypothetical protein